MGKVKSKIILIIISQFLTHNFLFSPPMLAPEGSEQVAAPSDLKIRLMPLGSGGGRGPKDKRRPTLRLKRYSENDPMPFGFSVIPKSQSPRLDPSVLLENVEIVKKVKVSTCAHLSLENLPKESWFGLFIEKKLDMQDGHHWHVYEIKCCCKQICLANFPQGWSTYKIADIPIGARAYYAIKLPKIFNFNSRAFEGGASVTIESMRDFPFPWFCIIRLG